MPFNIEFVILTSLICTGIFVCTWEGMIFYKLTKIYDNVTRKLLQSKKLSSLGEFLSIARNTLFGCMYCMSSLYTVVVYLTGIFSFKLYMLPFAAWCVCGCNAIIFSIIRFTVPGYKQEE